MIFQSAKFLKYYQSGMKIKIQKEKFPAFQTKRKDKKLSVRTLKLPHFANYEYPYDKANLKLQIER